MSGLEILVWFVSALQSGRTTTPVKLASLEPKAPHYCQTSRSFGMKDILYLFTVASEELYSQLVGRFFAAWVCVPVRSAEIQLRCYTRANVSVLGGGQTYKGKWQLFWFDPLRVPSDQSLTTEQSRKWMVLSLGK